MKRFFYTDPIAATWMAEHHGIRLELKFPWNERYSEVSPGLLALEYATQEFSPRTRGTFKGIGPYFIHPDSLHLLEPKPGDIARLDKKMVQVLERGEGGKWRKVWRCVNPFAEFLRCNNWLKPHALEILQRSGKAFIWPASLDEAACCAARVGARPL